MTGMLPLNGTRVVDFGIGGVGPWAGSQLAQLGAMVVKVEAPNEFILDVLPRWRNATTTYRALNLGKRSVTLDLKDSAGVATAWKLVEGADVMIENFRSGAMERLGFGFEAVRSRNPRIVYCTANGFGSQGEMAGLPCTDPHMQAFSGFASLNGHLPDGERLRFYGAVDLFTSSVIVEGILAALVRRAATGEAQRVEVTMLGGATTALLSQLAELASGRDEHFPNGRRGRHVHPDGIYRTQDRQIALTVEDDDAFRRFCTAIGRVDLLDRDAFCTAARRTENADELDKEIEGRLSSLPAEWWLIALRRARIPSAPVHRDHEVLPHREAWMCGHVRPVKDADDGVADEMLVAGPPWDFAAASARPAASPSPGQHTHFMLASEGDVWADLEQAVT